MKLFKGHKIKTLTRGIENIEKFYGLILIGFYVYIILTYE